MPCYNTGYDIHDIHALKERNIKRNKENESKKSKLCRASLEEMWHTNKTKKIKGHNTPTYKQSKLTNERKGHEA